jgi:GNAT superfamily N-acetyltransferase
MSRAAGLAQGNSMTNATRTEIAKWEGTEAAAWQSVWEATPPAVIDALGMSKDEYPSMVVFRAIRASSWFFNRMLVRVGTPVPREVLDAQIDRFMEAGVQHGACVPPESEPAELTAWLEARGLVRTTALARMIRGTQQLPSVGTNVEIRQAGREDATAFGDTALRGFGMPSICCDWFGRLTSKEGWRTYLAYVDGEPVGTGALYIHGTPDGTVGWIGFGSTLSDYRGRGIHRAMLARRMADAADLGCRWLQSETNLAQADEPTPSLNNMKRLGFEMAYARPNYVFTPAT